MRIGHWPARNLPSLSLQPGIAFLAITAVAPLTGWALAGERWLILMLLVLVGAVPVVIRWPIISGFGVYALLVPFDFVALGSGTLTKLVGVAAIAVVLSTSLVQRRLSRPPRAALWWALLLLWAAMTAAWAIIEPSAVLAGLETPLSLFLLYLVAVSVRASEKDLGWVCTLTVLGATLASGWAVLNGIEDVNDRSARTTLRVAEQAAGLNTFAASLIPPLALAIGGFIGLRSRTGKMLSIGAIGTISAGIYFTMSRGALVGIGVLVAVFLYRLRARWQIVLVVCLLIGVAATMPSAFLDRMAAVGDEDVTGSGRTKIWAVGIQALASHGIIGAGFRSFLDVYSQTVPVPPSQGGRASHNVYLGTWVELGIVGLALLLAALSSHLLAALRTRHAALSSTAAIVLRATEAAVYGLLATGFFNDLLWRKFFWLTLILLTWSLKEWTFRSRVALDSRLIAKS